MCDQVLAGLSTFQERADPAGDAAEADLPDPREVANSGA